MQSFPNETTKLHPARRNTPKMVVLAVLGVSFLVLLGFSKNSSNASSSNPATTKQMQFEQPVNTLETKISSNEQPKGLMNIASDATCLSQSGTVASGSFRDFALTIPANTASVTFDLCGSSIDTILTILLGSVQVGRCDDSNSQGCTPCGSLRRNEKWTLRNLQAGRVYTIRVSPYSAGGSFALRADCAVTSGQTVTTTTPPPQPTSSCPTPRVRKDWMDCTQAERDLYMNGYKRLKANGKLAVFTRTHQTQLSFNMAHTVDGFLPWHRYFIWEFEEQFRALGGEYSCFTLPYWDWTRNAGNEAANPMFSHGLGGNGLRARNNCVQDGLFREGQYTTSRGICLRRSFCIGCSWLPFETSQALVGRAIQLTRYGQFRPYLEAPNHNKAHSFLGGDMVTTASPDDPFFYLVHGMVDFMWALWQDCHNYENVQITGSNQVQLYGQVSVDGTMPYGTASRNGLASASWARASRSGITPREVFNIQGGFMNYKYTAPILVRSGVNFGACGFGSWISRIVEPLALQAVPRPGLFVSEEVDHHAHLVARALNGDAKAAVLVGMDVMIGNTMTMGQKRVIIADYACKKATELGRKHGGGPLCRFDPNTVERCGPGPNPLDISLGALMRKKGVAGNPCLMAIRKDMYPMAKMLGTLRELCNGLYDADILCDYASVDTICKEEDKNDHDR